MVHEARSPVRPATPREAAVPAGATDPRPAALVAWRPPPGWHAPDWLEAEPEPASLPMTKDRMRWCLHALGWSLEELARRVHTHESSIRQMARDRRSIPDALAIWLELRAAHSLSAPAEPDGWRSKPAAPEGRQPWRD